MELQKETMLDGMHLIWQLPADNGDPSTADGKRQLYCKRKRQPETQEHGELQLHPEKQYQDKEQHQSKGQGQIIIRPEQIEGLHQGGKQQMQIVEQRQNIRQIEVQVQQQRAEKQEGGQIQGNK